MLYQVPKSPRHNILGWLKHVIRPAHPVADVRELSSYLRADIGASDGSYPFRQGR